MEDPGWEGWGMKQSYPYLSYCLHPRIWSLLPIDEARNRAWVDTRERRQGLVTCSLFQSVFDIDRNHSTNTKLAFWIPDALCFAPHSHKPAAPPLTYSSLTCLVPDPPPGAFLCEEILSILPYFSCASNLHFSQHVVPLLTPLRDAPNL
uniref:Uncharacterized protein n=1 Tax=Picea glauca TaxID=3330 RepID=A0A117NGE9_PICGL|nr:hypothetical protein ABT39_MTgene1378 [Picea glauca]